MNNFLIIWFYRVFMALLLGIGVAVSFRQEWKYEQQVALTGCTIRSSEKRNTVVFVRSWFLLYIMAFYWLIMTLFFGPALSTASLLEFSLHLLVLLSLYFAVLLLLLPLLRRTISARACATLWLLPVFLYYNLTVWRMSYLPPLVVLRVPSGVVPSLLGLWAAGFVAVVLWHMFSHFRFRRALLRDARPVEEPDVVNLWWEEQRQVLLKRHIPLLTSPATTSPLTIGLFHSTMCLVLPERTYTLDQYRLIFRHELRHVQRRDVDTKCFYILCKALCWFNPLMWIAVRKASADLELSCDEMVVCGAEDHTRREYASLLLETAGDERGLTTCLSASASSLRRRLKGVMVPQERSSGALALGLIMATLVLCSGLVGVSTASGTAGDLLFSNPENVTFQSVTVSVVGSSASLREPSPAVSQALLEELSDLPVTRLATGQTIPRSTTPFFFSFLRDGEQQLCLALTDGLCCLTQLDVSSDASVLYRVDGPVDWDTLLALVE